MAWKTISDNDGYRTIEEIVFDTVTFFRNRGHKRNVPIEQAALKLGLSERKTRSLLYGETVALLGSECRAIKQRFAEHLDEQADDLARRSEQARMRRRQIELEL